MGNWRFHFASGSNVREVKPRNERYFNSFFDCLFTNGNGFLFCFLGILQLQIWAWGELALDEVAGSYIRLSFVSSSLLMLHVSVTSLCLFVVYYFFVHTFIVQVSSRRGSVSGTRSACQLAPHCACPSILFHPFVEQCCDWNSPRGFLGSSESRGMLGHLCVLTYLIHQTKSRMTGRKIQCNTGGKTHISGSLNLRQVVWKLWDIHYGDSGSPEECDWCKRFLFVFLPSVSLKRHCNPLED